MRKRIVAWGVFLVFIFFSAGFSQAAIDPVHTRPHLDKPARIVVHDAFSPVGTDHAGIVTVNYEGQSLRVEGETTQKGKPGVRTTLREYMGTLFEPWKFDFFEVRASDGRVLGYFLAHPEIYDGFFFDERNGLVIADGEFVGFDAEGS